MDSNLENQSRIKKIIDDNENKVFDNEVSNSRLVAEKPSTGIVSSENVLSTIISSDKTDSNCLQNDSVIRRRMKNVSVNDNEDESKQRILERDSRRDFRFAVEKAMTGIATLPNNWDDLTVQEQRIWVHNEYRRYCDVGNIPKSLTSLWVGSMINGDCEPSFDESNLPDWLDRDKFQRGQRFAMNYYAGITLAEMLSLYMLFSFEYGLKPLIVTGKSSEPFTAFKRYLSTGRRVRNWYTSDVWIPGTEASRDIQAVRKMHANVRKKLDNYPTNREFDEAAKINCLWNDNSIGAKIKDDFKASCKSPDPRQCPYVFGEDEQFKRPKSLNQFEMSGTQFGFMALVVLYPQSFGIHGTSDRDLDDFCHLWRGLGYLLGIEDEYNFCKGTLEEIKQRSRDFIEYWVKSNFREINPEWEHMMRCVVEGISYYLPGVSYERSLLYLADIIGIPMPRLRASLSYTGWIRFNLMKFTFNWTARFSGVRATMNRRVLRSMDRALEYNDEKLALLKKRSDITLAEQIAAAANNVTTTPITTIENSRDLSLASTRPEQSRITTACYHCLRNSSFYLCFFSACFILFLNLPIIVKNYAKNVLIRVDADATSLSS